MCVQVFLPKFAGDPTEFKFEGELDLTMLRQVCRHGQLDALLHDNALNANLMAPPFSVPSSGLHLQTVNHDPKSILDSEVYEIILGYVKSTCPNSTCF